MEQRTKAIVIIVGALIVFGLLVATLFDLFPGQDEPIATEETPVILPDRNEGLPEGAVFESGNAAEFAGIFPGAGSAVPQSALEREARDLAVFFIERFGTYSSDSGTAYITDLAGFMAPALAAQMESYRAALPSRDGFYSIAAELASIETDSFVPAQRSARFSAVLNRTEVSGSAAETYQQAAVISLSQSGSGEWLVSDMAWGERL